MVQCIYSWIFFFFNALCVKRDGKSSILLLIPLGLDLASLVFLSNERRFIDLLMVTRWIDGLGPRMDMGLRMDSVRGDGCRKRGESIFKRRWVILQACVYSGLDLSFRFLCI